MCNNNLAATTKAFFIVILNVLAYFDLTEVYQLSTCLAVSFTTFSMQDSEHWSSVWILVVRYGILCLYGFYNLSFSFVALTTTRLVFKHLNKLKSEDLPLNGVRASAKCAVPVLLNIRIYLACIFLSARVIVWMKRIGGWFIYEFWWLTFVCYVI